MSSPGAKTCLPATPSCLSQDCPLETYSPGCPKVSSELNYRHCPPSSQAAFFPLGLVSPLLHLCLSDALPTSLKTAKVPPMNEPKSQASNTACVPQPPAWLSQRTTTPLLSAGDPSATEDKESVIYSQPPASAVSPGVQTSPPKAQLTVGTIRTASYSKALNGFQRDTQSTCFTFTHVKS